MNSGKSTSKRKIFNDPIYGFISIPYEIIFDLVEHPYFQRLRRIVQLGLTNLVYSGANHTRFSHALGAMHLMTQAIDVIRQKGNEITEDEAKAVCIAILLHDIGHGPYSHALEHSIVHGINHEEVGLLLMHKLNQEFEGQLTMAIEIFTNKYHKKFLHQLVSSQLDMDRLDYLRRDSFFTGVSEGIVGAQRIIKMLNVVNDELAIEAKGIYSIEKFIIARRLMYWQVYLHKAVLSAEFLLMNILKRAKELAESEEELFATPALQYFLYNKATKADFEGDGPGIKFFAQLDDSDILSAIKVWAGHNDFILRDLSTRLLNRQLFKIELQNVPFEKAHIESRKNQLDKVFKAGGAYFFFEGTINNTAYNPESDRINILFKDGKVADIAQAADLLNISVLSKQVDKYYICYPK